MKAYRILIVTLVLLSLGLLLPISASAADSHECMHAGATISDLQRCVEHAIMMGHIDNPGIGRSLLAKLEAAQSALDRGQSQAAKHQLKAFMQHVTAQSGKHIDSKHAQHMIDHAQMVIRVIST